MATADSIWAFELGHRAREIAARLGVPALRFAPGPLPEQAPAPSAASPPEPGRDDTRAAERLAAGIEDGNLRKTVAKAIAFSLTRAASDRPV